VLVVLEMEMLEHHHNLGTKGGIASLVLSLLLVVVEA
jgi:hypothetical protein